MHTYILFRFMVKWGQKRRKDYGFVHISIFFVTEINLFCAKQSKWRAASFNQGIFLKRVWFKPLTPEMDRAWLYFIISIIFFWSCFESFVSSSSVWKTEEENAETKLLEQCLAKLSSLLERHFQKVPLGGERGYGKNDHFAAVKAVHCSLGLKAESTWSYVSPKLAAETGLTFSSFLKKRNTGGDSTLYSSNSSWTERKGRIWHLVWPVTPVVRFRWVEAVMLDKNGRLEFTLMRKLQHWTSEQWSISCGLVASEIFAMMWIRCCGRAGTEERMQLLFS